jgi:hypothetical protein
LAYLFWPIFIGLFLLFLFILEKQYIMKFVRIGENDAKKYDELIEQMPAFVKIYSPSCGYCQQMQKDWDALEKVKELKEYDIAIVEILVDATENIKSPSGKLKPSEGIPTIRGVKKNGDTWEDYTANRTTAEMVDFIKKVFKQGKNSTTIGTRKQNGGGKRKSNKRSSSKKRKRSSKTSKRSRSKNSKRSRSKKSKRSKY